jgi:hypothetical protein
MRKFLFTSILLVIKSLSAQTFLIPVENTLQTNFVKQDFTWDWIGEFNLYKEELTGPGVRLTNDFHSILITSDRYQRVQNNLDGFAFFKTPSTYHGIYVRSWYLQDKAEPVSGSRFGNHAMGVKAIYQAGPFLTITPYAGYQKSENRAIVDWGWDLGIDAALNRYSMGDYQTDLHVESNYDLYPLRRNASNSFDTRIKTRFSAYASDSLMVHYSKDNQQYFSSDGIHLIDVQVESQGFENFLYYLLSPRASVEFSTILLSRRVDDNTPGANNKRDIERFENRLSLRHSGNRFSVLLSLFTYQETQDNIDVVTDSRALQTTLQANFFYRIGQNDLVTLRTGLIKFQYDTPDSVINNDDRDEFRITGSLEYDRRFSDLFEAKLEFYANLYHKLYIFREQSANNNRNRIYKLQASARYANGFWRNTLLTYVLANYTIYDFDSQFSTPRSYVFRKYVLSDSMKIPVFPQISVGFLGRLELEDRGTFYEADFTQGLLESGRNVYYDIYLEQRNIYHFTFMAGVLMYQRDSWRHIPVKYQDRRIRKTSPYFRIVYPLGRRIRFNAFLSLTHLQDDGQINPEILNLESYETRRINTRYTTGSLNMTFLF